MSWASFNKITTTQRKSECFKNVFKISLYVMDVEKTSLICHLYVMDFEKASLSCLCMLWMSKRCLSYVILYIMDVGKTSPERLIKFYLWANNNNKDKTMRKTFLIRDYYGKQRKTSCYTPPPMKFKLLLVIGYFPRNRKIRISDWGRKTNMEFWYLLITRLQNVPMSRQQ